MPRFKLVLLFATVVGLGACTSDPNQTKLQYFPDMADSPAFKTQRNYIDPPEGSVARNAILYPDTPEEAGKVMHNPNVGDVKRKDFHLKKGKELFGVYCAPCHGKDGAGGGPIVGPGRMPPRSLITPDVKAMPDGHIFHRITFGSAIMPGYGHSTDAHERWQIITYLRTLQEAGAS